MKAARGFTLIEVLVALAIVAIGMAAVLEVLTSSANTTVYLQDKTFAQWVAVNRVETVRLTGTVPTAGTSNDDITFAGRSWTWQQKVTAVSQIPGMVQIEVDVRPSNSDAGDNKGWYASATGFMSNAIAPPTDPPVVWSQNPIVGLPTTTPGQPSANPTVTTPTLTTPTNSGPTQ
ncbi:MAG TPA: type II secretion system minor pseudopilin GspI [Steroidobacteraceae bacterium]